VLRLGELLNLKLSDVEAGGQLFTVDGKTGERAMRFGATTAKAVARYLKKRERVAECDNLWVTAMGTPLKGEQRRDYVPSTLAENGYYRPPSLAPAYLRYPLAEERSGLAHAAKTAGT